jgi:SAM-dependent methyltransferase
MDRNRLILKHIDVSQPGIEIAPYFHPLVKKADGHPVLYADIFDAARLRAGAKQDPNVLDERIKDIDEVDIVGDAGNIGDAVASLGREGQFQYIVSSHNFEHLSNPIRFLQGCERALKPGGFLSMAVPDGRACFDHFRMPTRLSDWLSAFHRGISQPSAETLFDYRANISTYVVNHNPSVGCDLQLDDPSGFVAEQNLKSAYAAYQDESRYETPYVDAHCTVTFGAALENMLWDLRYLGLISFDIVEVTATRGLEFLVHLRKPETVLALDDAAFYAARAVRLRKIASSLGVAGFGQPGPGQSAASLAVLRMTKRLKRAVARLVPDATYRAVQDWNRRRRDTLR